MKLVKLSKIALAISVIVTSNNVLAGSVAGTGGATEVTQLLNYEQLVAQVRKTIQQLDQIKTQVQIMKKEVQGLNNVVLNGEQFKDVYYQVKDVMRQGESLAYTAANVGDNFNKRFKDFDQYAKELGLKGNGDTRKYAEWVRQNLDNSKSALLNANLQAKHFDTEMSALREIEYQTRNAVGQKQLLQATNELLSLLSTQMISLRQMIAADTQARTQYEARMTEKDALEKVKYYKSFERNDVELEDQIFSTNKNIEDGV